MRRQDTSLSQSSTLIPPDVLMVKPISTDVDDCDHGHGELLAGWRNVGEQPWDGARMCAGKDEFIFAWLVKRFGV